MAGKLRPPLAMEARRLTMAGHRRRARGETLRLLTEEPPTGRANTSHKPCGSLNSRPNNTSTSALGHPQVSWQIHTPVIDQWPYARLTQNRLWLLRYSALNAKTVSGLEKQQKAPEQKGFHFTTLLACKIAQLIFSSRMTPNDLWVEKESEQGCITANKTLLTKNKKCTLKIFLEMQVRKVRITTDVRVWAHVKVHEHQNNGLSFHLQSGDYQLNIVLQPLAV